MMKWMEVISDRDMTTHPDNRVHVATYKRPFIAFTQNNKSDSMLEKHCSIYSHAKYTDQYSLKLGAFPSCTLTAFWMNKQHAYVPDFPYFLAILLSNSLHTTQHLSHHTAKTPVIACSYLSGLQSLHLCSDSTCLSHGWIQALSFTNLYRRQCLCGSACKLLFSAS